MKANKGPRIAATNRKPASNKLLSVSTKLVQEDLLPGCPEARSLKDSSGQDDNDVRLLSVKAGKKPKTAAANGKLASGKLLLVLTKLSLEIG